MKTELNDNARKSTELQVSTIGFLSTLYHALHVSGASGFQSRKVSVAKIAARLTERLAAIPLPNLVAWATANTESLPAHPAGPIIIEARAFNVRVRLPQNDPRACILAGYRFTDNIWIRSRVDDPNLNPGEEAERIAQLLSNG